MRATGVAILGVVAAASLGTATSGALAAARCTVSATEPVPGRTSFNVGTRRLAVSLPENATFAVVRDGRPGWAFLQPDGRIRIKLGWLSPSASPRVTGRRIDRPGRPLDARIGVRSFTSEGGSFYPSSLYFPSSGCWRITARNSAARIEFVVRLVGP